MKRTFLALAVAALGIVTWPAHDLFAQTTPNSSNKTRGTISALGANSITLQVRDHEMKFDVTSTTVVEAKGAGTKGRAAKAAGNAGPKQGDVVKTGEAVEVSYLEGDGGALRATRIRAVSHYNAGGASESKPSEMISSGTVKSISNSAMTITGSSGGGAKFTQSFAFDGSTKVIAKGGGTAAAANGGKLAITKVVGEGDRVSVSFHESGTSLLASEVRVRVKAAARPKT